MQPFKHITYASVTDIGCKRKNNEDASVAIPEHGFYCVADGMGGEDDGEVASGAVVEALERLFRGFDSEKPLAMCAKAAWITHTVDDVSDWIFQRSRQLRGRPGMGTTFAGVAFDPAAPANVLALHAGDSRIYHWSHAQISDSAEPSGKKDEKSTVAASGILTPITIDHSVANSVGVHDKQRLAPAELNRIMRAVGLAPSVQIDLTPFTVTSGDYVLVCSDGLSKMVPDANIASIFTATADPNSAARALVDAALLAGGKDNVTVIVIGVGSLPVSLPVEELNQTLPPGVDDFAIDSIPTSDTANTQDTLPIDVTIVTPAPNYLLWVLAAVAVVVLLGAVTYGVVAHRMSPLGDEAAWLVGESELAVEKKSQPSGLKMFDKAVKREPVNQHQDREDFFK